MTQTFATPTLDASTVIKLAEINVQAMTEVVNNQTKLLNDLLSFSVGQLKSAQAIEDVHGFIEAGNSYTQGIETQLRTTFDANTHVLSTAGKKGLDLVAGQKAKKTSSSK